MTGRWDVWIGTGLIAAWALWAIVSIWGDWPLDLTPLYFAAHFLGSGQPDLVYLPGRELSVIAPPEEYLAFAQAQGVPRPELLTPYLYPPLWAALLAPLAAVLPAQTFFNVFQLANVAALGAMAWLSWRFARPAGISFALWVVLALGLVTVTAPGYMSLILGQPQIIVSLIVLGSFAALAAGRDLTAGGLLALAAAMKLSPALLIVLFVMERRWRALGAFAGFGAGLAALSVLLAGWPLHVTFLATLSEINGAIVVSRLVASAELILFQLQCWVLGVDDWHILRPYMVDEPGWIRWVIAAITLGGMVHIHRATRACAPRERLWRRSLALTLLVLVVNPIPWIHYLVLPLIMLPGVLAFQATRSAMIVLMLTGGLLSMPAFLWFADHPLMGFAQVAMHLAIALAWIAILARTPVQDEALGAREMA